MRDMGREDIVCSYSRCVVCRVGRSLRSPVVGTAPRRWKRVYKAVVRAHPRAGLWHKVSKNFEMVSVDRSADALASFLFVPLSAELREQGLLGGAAGSRTCRLR